MVTRDLVMRGTSKTLAVCFAHPDDESYSTYGTVALHRDEPGFRLVVLHATDGGAGEIAPGLQIDRRDLGAYRRAEVERRATRCGGHVRT